jgi:hypothetical protein
LERVLASAGELAVQVPRQFGAPSHGCRVTSLPGCFVTGSTFSTGTCQYAPVDCAGRLSPPGQADVGETDDIL